ncbi:putative secreted glycosidase-like protein 3 [Colletotrichum chlorophyti]|uniref:Putative secreted glycosidase-like protein 3 n=1 Tax=Colletotrichum chlorophyti TaxID=708187 RepID=A0A1Q8RLC9_9PEZI|nr:putative secreted glycosidase-like protein 3 [Colletotrichum chlorophyti]
MRPLIVFPFLVAVPVCQSFDPLTLVDPLIGSQRGGNVFAGATLPYGLAKAVADVDGEKTGGFATDGSNITGFSILHDSGTGGNPSLGNFPLFPQVCPGDELNNCRFRIGDRATRHDLNKTVAEPGIPLSQPGVGFPSGNEHPLVMLDLTDLWASRQNASVKVDTPTGRMAGNGTILPSFGAGSYMLHYCIDFFGAKVFDTGVWVNNRAGNEPKQLFIPRGFNMFYLEGGGFVRFKELINDTVTARVGVSFKSGEQACRSAEREIPDPLGDFDSLVRAAKDAWREKLAPVLITPAGATDELQRSFWSGLYRNMISPQNYTGENPYWDSGVPYFDSFYCMWDSFRAQHPLLTVIDPAAQTQMVNSMLDIYKHEGWLPGCRMSLCKGWTQGGSNADVVIVDAFFKNLTSIDWRLALEAITKDAEDEPLEWSYQGRGGLASWKSLNYIPYLDFDPGLGEGSLHDKYAARSMNWQNLWKADQTSLINGTETRFAGFFQPKYMNGSWGFQDPIACSTLAGFCSLTTNPSETFEASIWQYQFIVPHSTSTLIDLMGGDDAFVSRLNYFHVSPLADISNEPVFLTVYLYHYAGRPGLSADRIHQYIPSAFNATHGGLPGNDDSGAMGAFLVFSIMGLFPVAGQDVYLITPPFFGEISIKSPVTGKTATVKCVGFDATYKNIYVQSARLDGQDYNRSWIGHNFFTQGRTLELTLGDKESEWGKSKGTRPPSYAAGSRV